MTPEQYQIIHAATKDSGWGIIKRQLQDEVERIRDVMTIETDRPSEQVAIEVQARTLAHAALSEFLKTMGMYERDPTEKKPPTSRFR